MLLTVEAGIERHLQAWVTAGVSDSALKAYTAVAKPLNGLYALAACCARALEILGESGGPEMDAPLEQLSIAIGGLADGVHAAGSAIEVALAAGPQAGSVGA
jgi:hypothetical protein